MAYEIQPSSGDTGQDKPGGLKVLATGFDGTNTITWTGNLAQGFPGRVMQLRGTPLNGDGNYMVVEQISNTSARIQPTPPNNAGVVSGTVLPLAATTATNRIHNALAVTGYPATNRIQAVGVGVGVKPLDHVALAPLQTNEGNYLIEAVIGNNEIQVFGNPLTAAAPAADTVTVRSARHELHFIDETAATMALAVAGATIFQANFGAVADYITETVHSTTLPIGRQYDFRGILQARLRNTDDSTDVLLTALNEIWVNAQSDEYDLHFFGEGTPTVEHAIVLGARTGDTLSGHDGCQFFGCVPFWSTSGLSDNETVSKIRASSIKGTALWKLPDGSEIVESVIDVHGSISMPGLQGATMTDMVMETVTFIGNIPPLILGPGLQATNLNMRAAINGLLNGATGATIEGLLRSSDGTAALYLVIASTGVVFLNPRADYDLTVLCTSFPGANASKRYTYNPRFVSRSGAGTPGDPIAGLEVRIYDVNETTQVETEISGSPLTTNASGRLPSLPDLVRQNQVGGFPAVTTDYSQRLRVQGNGFRAIDQVITQTAKFEGDVAVDFLATDYEGEVST